MIAEAATRIIRALLPCPRGMEPSVPLAEQTAFNFGYFRFPDENPNGKEYFNCSLVHWRGRNWLVTRRRRFTRMTVGVNDLVFWMLTGTQVSNPYPVKIFMRYPGENFEDPRAINVGGRCLISYCGFICPWRQHFCQQGYGLMLDDFRINIPMAVVYGNNREDVTRGKGHEKNWTPFSTSEGKTAFVYAMHPRHEVIMVEGGRVVKVYISGEDWSVAHWLWGEPRGGSPPVLAGDSYYGFFHSSLYHRTLPNGDKRRRYYMGAYRFNAQPPYEITGMTRKPILTGSMHDRRNPGAPACVFPCGALLQNGVWFVTLGVGDTACAWMEIPHDELLKLL